MEELAQAGRLGMEMDKDEEVNVGHLLKGFGYQMLL